MRNADDKRLTESQLLEMLGLESIQSLIRKTKLQWVAHCARRGEEDLTWKRIVREVEDGKSKWGTRLKFQSSRHMVPFVIDATSASDFNTHWDHFPTRGIDTS